jgi:hypothetical protein
MNIVWITCYSRRRYIMPRMTSWPSTGLIGAILQSITITEISISKTLFCSPLCSRLSRFALEMHDRTPDAYVVAAMYHDLKGNLVVGLKFIDQVRFVNQFIIANCTIAVCFRLQFQIQFFLGGGHFGKMLFPANISPNIYLHIIQALALDPNHSRALCVKGRLCFKSRQLHDAANYFRNALNNGPFLEASQGETKLF